MKIQFIALLFTVLSLSYQVLGHNHSCQVAAESVLTVPQDITNKQLPDFIKQIKIVHHENAPKLTSIQIEAIISDLERVNKDLLELSTSADALTPPRDLIINIHNINKNPHYSVDDNTLNIGYFELIESPRRWNYTLLYAYSKITNWHEYGHAIFEFFVRKRGFVAQMRFQESIHESSLTRVEIFNNLEPLKKLNQYIETNFQIPKAYLIFEDDNGIQVEMNSDIINSLTELEIKDELLKEFSEKAFITFKKKIIPLINYRNEINETLDYLDNTYTAVSELFADFVALFMSKNKPDFFLDIVPHHDHIPRENLLIDIYSRIFDDPRNELTVWTQETDPYIMLAPFRYYLWDKILKSKKFQDRAAQKIFLKKMAILLSDYLQDIFANPHHHPSAYEINQKLINLSNLQGPF